MNPHRILACLLVSWVWIAHPVSGRAVPVQTEETRIQDIEAELDSLQQERALLHQKAEELTHRIGLLRAQEPLSRNEHRDLEKRMQESRRVETAVREIDARITGLLLRYEGTLQSIVATLHAQIEQTLRAMETSGSENSRQAARLQELIDAKGNFEARLRTRSAGGSVYHVNANSWDTPSRLRMKGDLLLDQEESVREEIRRVDERISALIDEENVRRKVDELVNEMNIFDENEELFGRETESLGGAIDGSETFLNDRGETAAKAWSSDTFHPASSTFSTEMTAPVPRSAERIQEWIARLQAYRGSLGGRADSLQIRARWFHEEAGRNRD